MLVTIRCSMTAECNYGYFDTVIDAGQIHHEAVLEFWHDENLHYTARLFKDASGFKARAVCTPVNDESAYHQFALVIAETSNSLPNWPVVS